MNISLSKKVIVVLVILILIITVPKPARALSFDTIGKIAGALKAFRDFLASNPGAPGRFVFGGRITDRQGSGCDLAVSGVTHSTPPIPFYEVPIPLPIPALKTGTPIATPDWVLIFPFISNVYETHNEDKVGPWALGLGYYPLPIDQINAALDAIPPFSIGVATIVDMELKCESKYVVRLIGSSPP